MIFTVHSIFWKSLYDKKKLCALIRTLCEFSLNKLGKNPLKLNGFSIFFFSTLFVSLSLESYQMEKMKRMNKIDWLFLQFFFLLHITIHSSITWYFLLIFFGPFFMLSMGKSNQQRREEKSNEMSFVEASVVVKIERNIRLYPAQNESLDGKVATTTVLH